MQFAASALIIAAMLSAPTAARAQQTIFIRCTFGGSTSDFAVSGSAFYYWRASIGQFADNCSANGYLGRTAGDNCRYTVTDYQIVLVHTSRYGHDNTLTIDRASGAASFFLGYSERLNSGTCAKGTDPRTAPKAF